MIKDNLTSRSIRNNNSYNILKALVNHQRLQRSELTVFTKVSVITVNKIVDKLLAAGVLTETTAESSIGRKPKELTFPQGLGCFCCINLCKISQIGFFLYDIHSRRLSEGLVRVERASDFKTALGECLTQVGQTARQMGMPLLGVCVSVPSVYYEQEDAVNCDLIPGLENIQLKKLMREFFCLENIIILHDVCASAGIEYRLAHTDSLYYFYLGDGLGSAYVRKGELIQGDSYAAGEIGQGITSFEEKECTYESILSLSGLCSHLGASGQDDLEQLLKQYPAMKDAEKKKLDSILCLAGEFLYNICWILNPGLIVIDSSIPVLAELIQLVTIKKCERLGAAPIGNAVRVTLPKEKNHYAMMGCVLLLVERWIEEILEEASAGSVSEPIQNQ